MAPSPPNGHNSTPMNFERKGETMQQMDERKRVVAQVLLMATGLMMVIAGLLIWAKVFEIGPQSQLASWVLIGAGIGDLVISWFVFRRSE